MPALRGRPRGLAYSRELRRCVLCSIVVAKRGDGLCWECAELVLLTERIADHERADDAR